MMKRWMTLTFTLVMAAAIIVACGGGEYSARAVNEETDRCAHCNMAVADDAHATQIVMKDGRTLIFDDIGCMYAWMAEHGGDEVGQAFVRDYYDLGWVKTEKAYYVYDASFRTPMAYGVLSFADKADAEAFIAEQGKGVLMTAEDLSGHSWERNRDMMDGMGEHGHGADGAMHEGSHDGANGHDSGHDAAREDATRGNTESHGGGDAHGDGAGHGNMESHDGGEAHGGAGHDGMAAHPAAGAVSAA